MNDKNGRLTVREEDVWVTRKEFFKEQFNLHKETTELISLYGFHDTFRVIIWRRARN